MVKCYVLAVLRALMSLICIGWVSLWLLKPTNAWTRAWHQAEQSANETIFGYYGLNFAVLSFPVIALSMVGLIYLSVLPSQPRSRQARISATAFSNPIFINSFIGIISCFEILGVLLSVFFLAWTFYARISNDFKKLTPLKSMKLNLWELKYLRVATRFGLLAEACLALLLLPVLRGLSVFRLLGIQFEASVRYHVWLGTAMIFFSAFHGGSTLFIWGVSHYIQDEIWQWQKTGRIYLAGEIGLIAGLVIWITSLPAVRRKKFEVFYYTHHLYIVFLVLYLFHAGDRHFYWVFPGIFLFGLDKLLRIVQSRSETCVLAARVFPCKAVELVLPKDPRLKYSPSSILFVKIPSISKFQWHTFSIASSSVVDNQTVSAIIKCEGWWTNSLYNKIQVAVDSDTGQEKCIRVGVEGPYGPASVDFLRYESLVLVAGGIGITPFLSILQEIASARRNSIYKLPTRVQFLCVFKSCQDISMLTSISHILLNPPENFHLKVKIFITQEKHSSTTLGELLADVQTVYFETEGLKNEILGPESLQWMAALVGISSVVFIVFLIFLNHMFIPSEKKDVSSMKLAVSTGKKAPKEKAPSWIVDLVIIASFVIAITCSTMVAIILRWRKLNKEISNVSLRESKVTEKSSIELTGAAAEKLDIHFGGRPDFQEIFSEFQNEIEGSNIGVLVCGPESMKESVASTCQQMSQCLKIGAERTKPKFSFHSLNFTL